MANYTPEQTKEMIERYKENPCRETVETIAADFCKSYKSVVGKLSREGVYQRESYKSKTGEDPVTKEDLQSQIEMCLGFEPGELFQLSKAPKQTLKRLLSAVNNEEL